MSIHDQEKYWDNVAEEKEFPTPFQIEEFEKCVSNEMKTLENSMNFRCPENRRFSRILDVGCGYGRTLNELYNHGFKNLTGIDYSQGMINRGLRLYPDLNLIKTDGELIPFPDNKFDAVILLAVLTSSYKDEEQENLISEISRVLKDNGILYINDYLINQDKRNLKRYNDYKNKYGIFGVFQLPEGAVFRHHTKNHILKITEGFKELIFQKTVYDTMNGNKSNGFYYIGELNKKY
ncbi:MAG: class I SAM-dependent methyltransferase [Methanobacterium sp.]|uniref:class I SAM-dependent methyltransferase n=1 Tax=Methanobacterium sp. TaxID=2164 RepID=UPI003D654614|nr:class I SAM-dependent methyltransferase [Methanobacterium sp.]